MNEIIELIKNKSRIVKCFMSCSTVSNASPLEIRKQLFDINAADDQLYTTVDFILLKLFTVRCIGVF